MKKFAAMIALTLAFAFMSVSGTPAAAGEKSIYDTKSVVDEMLGKRYDLSAPRAKETEQKEPILLYPWVDDILRDNRTELASRGNSKIFLETDGIRYWKIRFEFNF